MKRRQCEACGSIGQTDGAHIKSKGSGGSDDDGNIIDLCRRCHSLQHFLGWDRFIRERERVEKALAKKGFEIVDEFGIKKLRRTK